MTRSSWPRRNNRLGQVLSRAFSRSYGVYLVRKTRKRYHLCIRKGVLFYPERYCPGTPLAVWKMPSVARSFLEIKSKGDGGKRNSRIMKIQN